ncbi:hypothetical protein CPAV1605_844 [seawater metagenome]|uniref:Uncharacterized protein n=1 Tax=seawater metagenome TaxID=1561972 RepID=A0A5E8CKC6_9ZZZZ
MSQLAKATTWAPQNASHYGAAPKDAPYCKDDSKITSYALCLNSASDYPKDDRRTFCSICPCGKDALKGVPKAKTDHTCGPNSSNCPNIIYQADGVISRTN